MVYFEKKNCLNQLRIPVCLLHFGNTRQTPVTSGFCSRARLLHTCPPPEHSQAPRSAETGEAVPSECGRPAGRRGGAKFHRLWRYQSAPYLHARGEVSGRRCHRMGSSPSLLFRPQLKFEGPGSLQGIVVGQWDNYTSCYGNRQILTLTSDSSAS